MFLLVSVALFGCGKQTGPGANASAPSVSSVYPVAGATAVSRNTYLTATFSQSMDASSITTSTFKLSSSSGFVTGTISYDASSKTATFTPSAVLGVNTAYSATVYTGVKNSSGIGMNADYVWNFTTGSSSDVLGPTVVSVSPVSGATAVSTSTVVSVIFNEALDPSTLTDSTFTLSSTSSAVTGTATYSVSTKTAYFTPSSPLDYNTTYTALLINGITDLAGNPLYSTLQLEFGIQYTWSFSTENSWIVKTTSASFPNRRHHASLAYDGKVWVIGGWDGTNYMNDVWYTSDGATWTRATASANFDARTYHAACVFDGKMWVIGGQGVVGADGGTRAWRKDVWYSTDGKTWTRETATAPFGERTFHKLLAYDSGSGEKMWLIAGTDNESLDISNNDVWSTSDGSSWTRVTSSAAFSARVYFDALVYDSKMWVIGGFDTNRLNDVWYSTDGSTWTQANGSADFEERTDFVALNYDGYMWVLGGYHTPDYDNDVWRSTNGVTWTEQSFANSFTPRIFSSGVVQNSKMWILGGTTTVANNDVWVYP